MIRTPLSTRAPLASNATIGSRNKRLIFALCLTALANVGCSKDEPTKDQLLSRADAAVTAGQYDKAEKDYREVLRLAPEEPAALRQLAVIYLDQGQLLQAYPLLKKSAELQPDDPEIQLKLGLLFLAVGSSAEAREAALQVLEKQPGNQEALLLLVDASRKPEDIEDARKLIQSLREKDHDRAQYHLALGGLDLRQNEPARAESEFKTALSLDPKSSEINAALGSFYWSHRDRPCDCGMRISYLGLAPQRRQKIFSRRVAANTPIICRPASYS
jgi:tetratricopeptide (TPR) repeat protein